MRHQPKHIKIVHGDEDAKQALAEKYHLILRLKPLNNLGVY